MIPGSYGPAFFVTTPIASKVNAQSECAKY